MTEHPYRKRPRLTAKSADVGAAEILAFLRRIGAPRRP
jgi:hypothetical protein